MPKKRLRKSVEPKEKTQQLRQTQGPQAGVDASHEDLSSNLSNDRPTEPATDLPSDPSKDLPTDHLADVSENQAQDLLMSSSKEAGVELSMDTSKDLSMDPSKGPSKSPSNGILRTRPEPSTNPFKFIGQNVPPRIRYYDWIRGFSITPKNLAKFDDSGGFTFHEHIYPNVYDIQRLANNFLLAVDDFSRHVFDRHDEETVDDDEIDRVQQLCDEFGQVDPDFPPRLMAERLRDLDLRYCAVERILKWALITHIAVDGDINYTLLPPRVLALYRDLDRDSELAARWIRLETEGTKLIDNGYVGSDAHRTLFNRWSKLTFGLLAGGHDAYQVSAETLQRTDRIRQFIIKLLGPYSVEHRNEPIFSEKLDLTLQWAVATGYHLMGMGVERYRWDWTWQEPVFERGGNTLGKPPPRRPREEEVPEGMWVTGPALVKETDAFGNQLKFETTVLNIRQRHLVPTVLWTHRGLCDDLGSGSITHD